MKITQMLTGVAAATLLLAGVANAADVSNAKCPVSGKPAKEASAVDFDGGKVYMCCDNCPKAFEKNTDKFAAKAHHQMVVTGQAKQQKCPFSGGATKADTAVEIDGVSVVFCCPKCKAKVEKAEADKKIELCFGNAGFKKGFKVGE
jgi:YHS domain-containing protein